MDERLNMVVIGAGPAGLACGIAAAKRRLDFRVIEKGCVVNSVYHYPANMTFFTTADLLEIGNVPMVVSSDKPKRVDALKYYRRVADHYHLPIQDHERVVSVSGVKGDFEVETEDRLGVRQSYRAARIIVATGYYDNPNYLGVPGENLPKVSHYFSDPHPFFRKNVVVIGGNNSAAEAALELYRQGDARVTIVHRGEAMGKEIKYWVLPDINNRIDRGEIRAFFRSRVMEIRQSDLRISTPAGDEVLENDYVFAMTGYHPDHTFLAGMGVIVDPESYIPQHDPVTLETNVPGIYLAGSVVSGKQTNRVFIENGRLHGAQIFEHWEGE